MSSDLLSAEALAELVSTLELPCFVYDPATLAVTIRQVRVAFPAYRYPVKANPHPALVRAAIDAGAELDLCSGGDLELARDLGALTARTSYTGVGVTPELMQRIAETACMVNLDSLHEVTLWAQLVPGRPCGMRVQLPRTRSAYGDKFGSNAEEVRRGRDLLERAGGRLAGLHVHDGHRGRSPAEAAAVLAGALRALDDDIIAAADYICLGGGWPFAYEAEEPWRIDDVRRAIDEIVDELHGHGFRGELLVEPGEFVVSSAGAWIARVAAVKSDGAGERLVILDTPTPVPFADIAYSLDLLRGRLNGSFEATSQSPRVTCAVYGATNSGRDCIRRHVRLPDMVPGDVVVVRDAGAYVRPLISTFNERTPPREYVVPRPS